jgi:protein phosphatase
LRDTTLLQLTKDQGSGHILYNALGIAGDLVAEKVDFDLESGDLIMLSTDGVHDYITEDSLKEHLINIRNHFVKSKFYNLDSFIKHLIGSTRDNFTFVVGIVE